MSAVARISSPIPNSRRPSLHEVIRRIAVLERAPVFFGLPDRALRALARRVRRISVRAGETIVYQGEPGDTIFVIEQGACRVVIERAPAAVAVATLGEGDLFGEAACVLVQPQQASVYAETDCALVALDRPSLYAVLGRDRDFIDELTTFARQRVEAFGAMASRAGWGAVHGEGSVIAMYAPRGGSGATCFALNLVGSLAARHTGQVILLDLDLPYAHAALLAGLVPASCLARVADAPPDLFEEELLSAILYHPDGPMILAGALRPEEADTVTADLITRALAVLRRTFRYIVVDLSPAVSEPVLAALDAAEQVVVVTAPDLSSVKSAADAIDILGELGVPDGRLAVLLNHRSSNAAVERAAVERLLRRRVDVEAGFDGPRPDVAALKGEILSLTTPRSEIAKAAATLADLLETRSSARIGGRR
jgi:Flp pilus assembly CpaE family ATPase